MDKINNIWVGTDLSPRAAYALMRAAALAGEQQARLSALQVIPGAGGDYTFIEWLRLDPAIASRAESDIEQAAYMEMQRQVQALPAQVPTDVNVKIGSPHIKVVEQARRAQADLIVVGAHGEGFVRDLLFGTITERVIRNGDRPVLVVKRPPEAPLSPPPGRGRFFRYRLRGPGHEPAARACGGDHRIACLRDQAPAAPARLHVRRAIRGGDETIRAAPRRGDGAFLRRCDVGEAKVRRLIRPGYPGTAITHTAGRLRADLVAVGTHGMGGLRYVLLGSVAEHVLREARCDVLAVRPKDFRFALP